MNGPLDAPGPRPRRFVADGIALAVIGVMAAAFSAVYLFAGLGPIGITYGFAPVWFETSVMVACGKGFATADPAEVPGLADFLDQKQMTFSPSQVPATAHIQPAADVFNLCHRYLFTFMGYNWRLFGISWTTFKIPLVIAYTVTALIAFGLCRLAMGRVLSVLCTALFMMSPALLVVLPSIRDFFKAPFILGALFVMGLLLRRPLRLRAYLALAAMLGLVMGVGLGFRQDLLVCIPPALAVLLVGARGVGPLRWRPRVLAAAVYLAVFLATAFPILKAMATLDSGAVSTHTLVQGFSEEATNALKLGGSSYEVLCSTNDNFVYATVNSYARRTGDMAPMFVHSPEYARAGKRMGVEVITTFPGDMIARTYAAIPAVLGSVAAVSATTLDAVAHNNLFVRSVARVAMPLTDHLGDYALVYAAAALTVLSLRSTRAVWTVFFLCAYMFGYTSLLFQQRHCFHFSVVSWLMMGFLAGQLIHAGGWFVRPGTRRALWQGFLSPRDWMPAVRRAVGFWVLLVVLLGAPLYVARVYQHHALGRLLDTYAGLTLQRVETEAVASEAWVRFAPKPHFPFQPRPCDQRAWSENLKEWGRDRVPALSEWLSADNSEVPAEYYVAAFSPDGTSFPVRVDYQTKNLANDFSQVLTVESTAAGGQEPDTCFFPVYLASAPSLAPPVMSVRATPKMTWARAHFVGLTVPEDQAQRFRGLYRVVNVERCPLFLFLSLPSSRDAFRAHKTLRPEGDAWYAGIRARFAYDHDRDAAIAAYRNAIDWFPQCPEYVPALDALLAGTGDVHRRAAVWQAIAGAHGEDRAIQTRYADALRAANQPQAADAVLHRLATLPPVLPMP